MNKRQSDKLEKAHEKAIEVLRFVLASAMCVVFVLLVASV
jgi:hypothetical protein